MFGVFGGGFVGVGGVGWICTDCLTVQVKKSSMLAGVNDMASVGLRSPSL